MSRKPVVYVASPYTKGDPCINTHCQVKAFNKMLNDGIVTPVIPLTSHFLHTVQPRSYEDWIEYDLSLIEVMDAVLRLDAIHEEMDYEVSESSGADDEVETARKLDKPVFFDYDELYDWANHFINLE